MLTSKLCPLGAVCPWPAPGLYACIKSWKKLYKIRFFWNLQQMTKVTRCSCWHKNVVPKGLSAPALGLYTCIKSWKKLYKIRLQRDFLKLVANDQSDKRFLLTSKFCPLRLSVPDLRLYTFIKSWKDGYKVRGWRDSFFNLQQMTIVIRPSCWHKIFGLNGLSAPAQGLCLNFFSSLPLILTYPQHSGERYRTNGPLVFSCSSYLPPWSYAPFEKIEMKSDACNILWSMHARVLKFRIWIPHGKITDSIFFLVQVISLSGVIPLWKNQNESCQLDILKRIWARGLKLGQRIGDDE